MAVSVARWKTPTRGYSPRIGVELTFKKNEAFFDEVKKPARKVVKGVAKEVKKQAQHNVAPGVGPGPHPHRTPHEDMGDLMRAIFYRTYEKGDLVGALIGATGWPGRYGFWLEIGWHAHGTGNFWQYPWLLTALREAAPMAYARGLGYRL